MGGSNAPSAAQSFRAIGTMAVRLPNNTALHWTAASERQSVGRRNSTGERKRITDVEVPPGIGSRGLPRGSATAGIGSRGLTGCRRRPGRRSSFGSRVALQGLPFPWRSFFEGLRNDYRHSLWPTHDCACLEDDHGGGRPGHESLVRPDHGSCRSPLSLGVALAPALRPALVALEVLNQPMLPLPVVFPRWKVTDWQSLLHSLTGIDPRRCEVWDKAPCNSSGS